MDQSHISPYKSLDFFARQVVEGFITGRHRSPFHGFSAQFSDYRHYNTGENTRHIDWRLFARTDRLFVKQFEEETNLRCQLLLDHSNSMLFPLQGHNDIQSPNKLTFSVYAAAVLIELLHRQRDAFGLTLLNNGIDLQTPCRSNAAHQRHLLSLLQQLLDQQYTHEAQEQTPDTQQPSLPSALHITAEQLHRRSLVILFTDAFIPDYQQEELFDALRHLRHNQHEVILFHTFHRALELNLDFGSRPYRFIDLETQRRIHLQPDQLSSEYSRQMDQLQSELHRRALQYRIDYIPVDVAQGFHQIILPFLLRRAKHI